MVFLFDLIRIRFLETCSPGPSSFNSFPTGLSTASVPSWSDKSVQTPSGTCPFLNTCSNWLGNRFAGCTSLRNISRVVAGRMCSGAARYKLVLCPHQNNSTKHSVVPSLMSKNPSWSNPISVPTWSRLCLSFRNAPDARKFAQLEFDVFLVWCSQAPTVRTCLQIHVRCVRSDFQVLLHRDWICDVRGLRVPQGSTVCFLPLERAVSFDSVKFIVYARDT